MTDEAVDRSIFASPFDPFSSLHADVERLRRYSKDFLLADHYMECGDMLIDLHANVPDLTVCERHFQPLFYLYRHALELDLKSVIRAAEDAGVVELSKEQQSTLNKHSLLRLWEIVRDQVWERLAADERTAKNISARLKEIEKIDPFGQAFRYARLKNGTDPLSRAPEVLDFGNLREVVSEIHSWLQSCYDILQSNSH